MLQQSLSITFRRFWTNKRYFLTNLIGFTVAISVCVFGILFVFDELSYDQHHVDAQSIYRITMQGQNEEVSINSMSTLAPVAVSLQNEYPEIIHFVTMLKDWDFNGEYEEKQIIEDNFFYASKELFHVFSYDVLYGDLNSALAEPNTLVLTRTVALKYFNSLDIVGKTITRNGQSLIITAIVEDPKTSSHFHPKGFISITTLDSNILNQWGSFDYYQYIRTVKDFKAVEFQPKLNAFFENNLAETFSQMGMRGSLTLQKLTDIHLHSKGDFEIEANGDINQVYIFISISILLIVIAVINYVNLATSAAAKRAREIGIKKVMGSYRSSLIIEFLLESIILVSFAVLLGILIAISLMPSFNALYDKEFTLLLLLDIRVIMMLLFLVILSGTLGAAYPAFYLSSFRPIEVLKNTTFVSAGGGQNLRRFLLLSQFTLSAIVLVSVITTYNQLQFLGKKSLGMEIENVLTIPMGGDHKISKIDELKTRLLQIESIENASIVRQPPGESILQNPFKILTPEGEKDFVFQEMWVDEDFVETLNLEIVRGRDFSKELQTDGFQSVLVNEAALRLFSDTVVIGRKIETPLSSKNVEGGYASIVGVVKDFHVRSLHDKIAPMVFINSSHPQSATLLIKLKPGVLNERIADVERIYSDILNENFEYVFMDQFFNRQYKKDSNRFNLLLIGSVVTLIMSCIGFLGLLSYTVSIREKEICIRKVSGATGFSIFFLLLKEFFVLSLIAFIIAFPIAYFIMSNWLESFSYRINLSAGTFILSAVVILVVSTFTVSQLIVRTIQKNPAILLRNL